MSDDDRLWVAICEAGARVDGKQDFSWKRAADKAREIVSADERARIAAILRKQNEGLDDMTARIEIRVAKWLEEGAKE